MGGKKSHAKDGYVEEVRGMWQLLGVGNNYLLFH